MWNRWSRKRASDGTCGSWGCDFTKKIYELANLNCKVNPVTSEEFVRPAKRPKNSMLSKEKLKSVGIEVPLWENALDRYLKNDLK